MKQLLKRNSVVQKTSRKLKNAGKSKNSTGARNNNDGSGVVFSVVAVVVIFGSLLGIVVVQTFIVQNRVRLDAVNADLDDAREINQQLRLEVIELEAPERILDTAVTRLGMTLPPSAPTYPAKIQISKRSGHRAQAIPLARAFSPNTFVTPRSNKTVAKTMAPHRRVYDRG